MAIDKNKNFGRLVLLLEKFSNATGVSGYESNIEKIFIEEITPFVDEVRTDKLGNLIAHKKGDGLTIMLTAHMDEIGFMIKHIDEKGFIFFSEIGGFFDQTILHQKVIVHGKKGPVLGVIGAKPIHIMKVEDRKKMIEQKEMFIDIGVKDAKGAKELGVEIGSTITVDSKFERMANNNVVGKAFDDRAGLAMLVEAMRRISKLKTKADIFIVGTIQEEVGLKGARTSAFGINPDLALATDVAIPGDHPGITKQESTVEMGKGAVITIMDANGRGMIASEKVVKWLRETAEKNKIAHQMQVADGGTTDAAVIQLSQSGIPAGSINVPARNIHSPVEMVNLFDVEECAELIAQAILSADKYFSK